MLQRIVTTGLFPAARFADGCAKRWAAVWPTTGTDIFCKSERIVSAVNLLRPCSTNPVENTESVPNEAKASVPADEAPSIQDEELRRFRTLAGDWWNPSGAYGPLHNLNPARCKFIRNVLCCHYSRQASNPEPLIGLSVLDVGCGGGLLCEPIARMGATVTGVDVLEENIDAAKVHSKGNAAISSRLVYRTVSAEKLAKENESFDVVLASEVIEHVKSPVDFLSTLISLVPDGGLLILSTLNRTPRSYMLAIVGAEYLTGYIPRGTHTWTSFLTPEELVMALDRSRMQVVQMSGMVFNPVTGRWALGLDTSINYIAAFQKSKK